MATKTIKVPKMLNGTPTGEVEDVQIQDYGTQSWGPKDKHTYVNTKIPRADAPFKTTGTARYTHDVRAPGMLHGRFVCSPYAHATIAQIDLSPALKIDGVKAAVPVLAVGGEVLHEGQPVVAVVATTIELAEDAARAVVVTYNKLPHVVTIEDALKPGAPVVIQGRGGGRGAARGGAGQGTPEAAEAALKNCDAVVETEYYTPILHHCCLETHSAVVDFRGGADATVYVSTQGTASITEASREVGVPVTGVVENMGGGFGSKTGQIGPVGVFAARLAKQLRVPVKFLMTRKEEFLTTGNGPGARQKIRAGANKDGTLVAMNVIQWTQPGLSGSQVSPLPYQYRAQTVARQGLAVNTHEDGAVPMRAPGNPQSSFVMESILDDLAAKLGLDPIAFRKKNLADTAWHRQLDMGAKAMNWATRNPIPGAGGPGSAGPLKRGMGCAIGAWAGGGSGGCEVRVNIAQDGTVIVTNASQDLGTGTRTYVRSIVAEELGLPLDQVIEKIGHTDYGTGKSSGGSTTTASLAPACKDAGVKARAAMAKLLAPIMGADADALWFNKGQVLGGGKAVSWAQACKALPPTGLNVVGNWVQALSGRGAHGASFAEVEVDTETGHVRVVKMAHVQDGGLIVNRLQVESQINGGMIQSLGMALYEGRVMDTTLGAMVNPTFNDYKIPGCMEIPELIPIIDDGDDRNVVMGIAEPANIPGCGAIANAVLNAIGVRITSTPITPDKILNGLMQQRRNV